jgi:hypothetical protein
MTNVGPVSGAGQPPEPGKSKKATDEFQKVYAKVEEVKETDPDQRKKKRAQKADEEDLVTQPDVLATPPPAQVPPFMAPTPPVSKKTVLGAEGPASTTAAAATPPPPQVSDTEEPAPPEEGYWEEEPTEDFSTQQQQYPTQFQQPQQTQQTPPQTPQPTPSSFQTPQRTQATSRTPSPTHFEQLKPTQKKPPTEEDSAIVGESLPLTPPPPDFKEKHPKKGEETASGIEGIAPQAPAFVPLAETPPSTVPPYFHMTPAVFELFEKMSGVMTVMTTTDVSETVITLNNPDYASSPFFGTQITISEYSTAPKQFNIELAGSPEAVAIFQENVDDLMAAFQGGNYNFKVNRFETRVGLPLVRRKESAADEGKK